MWNESFWFGCDETKYLNFFEYLLYRDRLETKKKIKLNNFFFVFLLEPIPHILMQCPIYLYFSDINHIIHVDKHQRRAITKTTFYILYSKGSGKITLEGTSKDTRNFLQELINNNVFHMTLWKKIRITSQQ